jgi:hypothetical protein
VRLRHDFSIFASFEQFQWHWARESFYSHELARPQSQWQMVSVGEGQSGLERAFALFTINYNKNNLIYQ